MKALDGLREALAKGTKGRWAFNPDADGNEASPKFTTDAHPYGDHGPSPIVCGGPFWSNHDGDKIVLSVNLAPYLVAVAEAADGVMNADPNNDIPEWEALDEALSALRSAANGGAR